MNSEMIYGIVVIFLAYAITWLLLLRSVKIIKFINAHDIDDIKEIQDKLNLKGRRKK